MNTINENNINDINDSIILENTPMVVIEQNGKKLAIPIMCSGSANVSGVTATAGDVLNTVKFVDSTGTLQSGTIATVTATLADNTVTIPKGYIAQAKTLTVAEMSEPSVSANVVTISKGYNKDQKTVTIPEATVTNDGETATVSVGYLKTPQQFNLGGGGTAEYPSASYMIDNNIVTITPGVFETETMFEVGVEYTEDDEIVPGTANTEIPANTYLPYSVSVKGDSNLVASNIKKDVTIFGVTGAYEGGDSNNSGPGTSFTPGTATADYVLEDYTFTAPDGTAQPGTMPNRWDYYVDISDGNPIYDDDSVVIEYQLPYGFYNGAMAGIRIAGLTSGNIRKGVSILGVDGQYEGSGSGGTTDLSPEIGDGYDVTLVLRWKEGDYMLSFDYLVFVYSDHSTTGSGREWVGHDVDENTYRLRYMNGGWTIYNLDLDLPMLSASGSSESDPWDCDWMLAAGNSGYYSAELIAIDNNKLFGTN